MITCSECQQEKENIEFLWLGKRGNFRVTYCNACASELMKAYYVNRVKPDGR